MYVGLAVCAHDNTKLNTSSFDNVSVTAGVGAAGRPAATMVAASRRIAPAHLIPAATLAADVLQVTQGDVLGKKSETTLI
jgi:hypothetical protein